MLWQPGMDPGALAGLASTRTYPLNSSFRPSYNMAVNLTGWAGRARAAALLESSFAQFQADRGVVGLTRQVRRNRQAMADLATAMTCDQGDFAEYARAEKVIDRTRGRLVPGPCDLAPGGSGRAPSSLLRPRRHHPRARRPAGRPRRGPAARPAARPGRRRRRRATASAEYAGPGPLVLTEGRQVKRLAVADFPVPAEVIDKIRIPGSFSPRSPQHRKDLAATMRNRLASHERGHRSARRPTRAADWERTAPEAAGEITDLRRRLRRHPCHACPDRENHARYAERYFRLRARPRRSSARWPAGRT